MERIFSRGASARTRCGTTCPEVVVGRWNGDGTDPAVADSIRLISHGSMAPVGSHHLTSTDLGDGRL